MPIRFFESVIEELDTTRLCYLTQESFWQAKLYGHTQTGLEQWAQDLSEENGPEKEVRLSAGCSNEDIGRFYEECQYGYVVDAATLEVLLKNGFDPKEHYKLVTQYTENYFLYMSVESGEIEFEGDGTKENPFQISSPEDLCKLSKLVNDGVHFSGKYFLQRCDIDMEGQDFKPIGIYEDENSENFFYGSYDGGGHVIYNLTIVSDTSGNVGLFGRLGGQVYNLGLEGGIIQGNCVGGIASHAVGDKAAIVNCYTDVKESGLRVGGIADNFAGLVGNSFSAGSLEGQDSADAISYHTTQQTQNVFTIGEDALNTLVSDSKVIHCTAEQGNTDFVVAILNQYVEEKNTTEALSVSLIPWKVGDGGHPVFDLSQQGD